MPSEYLGAWAAIFALFGTGQAALLPHPSCKVTTYPSDAHGSTGSYMECQSNELHIPANFNVDALLYSGAELSLNLGDMRGALSSVISDNVHPIPAGVHLRDVTFFHFQSDGTWDHFETFLSQVKGNLRELLLVYCHISRLPATFLRGYYAIESVDLSSCQLEAVHLLAFNTGSALPSRLQSIRLAANKLDIFDWSTFQPTVNSLREVDLSGQIPPLIRITNSKNTIIRELWSINVANNQLSFSSLQAIRLDRVMLSQPEPSWINWDLSNNHLCPDDPSRKCACCEARDFVALAHSIDASKRLRRLATTLHFTCGDPAAGTSSTWRIDCDDPERPDAVHVSLPAQQQYDCCLSATCPTPPPKTTTTSSTTIRVGFITTENRTSVTATLPVKSSAVTSVGTTSSTAPRTASASTFQKEQHATGPPNVAKSRDNRTLWTALLVPPLALVGRAYSF